MTWRSPENRLGRDEVPGGPRVGGRFAQHARASARTEYRYSRKYQTKHGRVVASWIRRVPWVLAFTVWAVGAVATRAQPVQPKVPTELRVAVSPFTPFVFLDDNAAPRGFSIELWEEVARKIGVRFTYVRYAGVAEKLVALKHGDADVAIGGITMTKDRENIVDFTHPSLRTGLGLMVRDEREELGLWTKLKNAIVHSRSGVVFGFLLLIVIAGHAIWWAERGKDAFDDRYIPGVFEGMYWAIVTASTVGYGDKAPVKWAGRAFAGIVIIISLPLFAIFTAELTSAFTVQEFQARIVGFEDLRGHKVAVIAGTTSEEFGATQRGMTTVAYKDAVSATDALLAGEVDALIYDHPNLRYFAKTEGKGRVRVVGGVLHPHDLGFATVEGSPLRERINRALLETVEAGTMARLRARWFAD